MVCGRTDRISGEDEKAAFQQQYKNSQVKETGTLEHKREETSQDKRQKASEEMKNINWDSDARGFKTNHWEISEVKTGEFSIENKVSFYLKGVLIRDSNTLGVSNINELIALRDNINVAIKTITNDNL